MVLLFLELLDLHLVFSEGAGLTLLSSLLADKLNQNSQPSHSYQERSPAQKMILTCLLTQTADSIMRVRRRAKRRRPPETPGPTFPLAQGRAPGSSGLGHSQGALQIFTPGWGQRRAPL